LVGGKERETERWGREMKVRRFREEEEFTFTSGHKGWRAEHAEGQ